MLMNIILGACLWPTMLIVSLVIYHSSLPKKDMAFGIRLTEELRKKEVLDPIIDRFKKRGKRINIILNLIPVTFFISKHVSISLTLWIHWFLIGLFIMGIPFAMANKELMTEKKSLGLIKDEDLNEAENNSPLYIELSVVRRVRLLSFLPQIALSLIFASVLFFAGKIFSLDSAELSRLEVYRWVAFTYALITPLFYLMARWMDNLSVLVISENSDINIAYARAKKQIWKNVWCFNAWVNTLVLFLIAITALFNFHCLLIFIVASIFEAFLALWSMLDASKKAKLVEDSYAEHKEEGFDPDDDRYWIYGMFYNNPKDKRTMVEKRFGIGSTFNMASKAGRITNYIAFFSLIWIPFMCIWLIMEDFTPMHVICEKDAVVCSHIKEDYTIPYDEITDLSLMTELPSSRSKNSGTGTDTMEKGRYSSRTLGGSYYTFVNPENNLFIRIDTENKIYIICGYDDMETQEIYDILLAR